MSRVTAFQREGFCVSISVLIKHLFVSILFISSGIAYGDDVITYIIKQQEERKSTRFTLTEWLKIKERMKLMDVWLAMFSKPEHDVFSPELRLTYGQSRLESTFSGFTVTGGAGALKPSVNTTFGRAQLWLTNLFSGTVGIRMLNIDLGFEGEWRKSKFDMPNATVQFSSNASQSISAGSRSSYLGTKSLNLRIFGDSIQDSSFVLRIGQYNATTDSSQLLPNGKTCAFRGTAYGGDLQLYINHWLGLDASYTLLENVKDEGISFKGHMFQYGIFVEISLLSFGGGVFEKQMQLLSGADGFKEQHRGYYMSTSLYL